MKIMKRITTLLLALTMVLMMGQIVYAVNGGTFTYRGGDTIEGDDAAQQPIDFSGLEPGDSRTLEFTYVNESDATTIWYLSNDVITSLEDGIDEADGGYTYILENNGKKEGNVTLFDSDAVGGDEEYDPDKNDKGLHDAVNALGEEEWIYIDELAPGERGTTTLTFALDAESQTNMYEDRDGTLMMAYAVEKQAPGETIVIPPGPKTGDGFNPLFAILALTAALLAMLLAVLSYFKDRKDGEEA